MGRRRNRLRTRTRRRRTACVGLVGLFVLPMAETSSADSSTTVVDLAAGVAEADDVADHVGGIAARVRSGERAVPGAVFMLMATAGSTAPARVFDATGYAHGEGFRADMWESNLAAVDVVEAITGRRLRPLELTTAPGGGSSAGIAYVIAYLNSMSGGAFTRDLRVAATGRLGADGYIHRVWALEEKTAAAHLADAGVMFVADLVAADTLAIYGARQVGVTHVKYSGARLADERGFGDYRAWGERRPDGMDVVVVRHVGDVAAYLCGDGSEFACEIMDSLADEVLDGGAGNTARSARTMTSVQVHPSTFAV